MDLNNPTFHDLLNKAGDNLSSDEEEKLKKHLRVCVPCSELHRNIDDAIDHWFKETEEVGHGKET